MFRIAADQLPFSSLNFVSTTSASGLCLASVRLWYKIRFRQKGICLRRVFPGIDFCHTHLPKWEAFIGQKYLIVPLLVVLASTAALQAQSGSGAPSDFPGFIPDSSSGNIAPHLTQGSSTPDLNYQAGSETSPCQTTINFENTCAKFQSGASLHSEHPISSFNSPVSVESAVADSAGQNSKAPSLVVRHPRPDFNQDIYYRNRLEFGLDVGWHPINIPFVYDFAVGDSYNMTPLKYTLVPIIASLRWHVTNVGWRWVFRGNMDFTFSGSVTPIPRGPETHYYSFMFGIRRNFVYRNWKLVPFFEQRGGAGMIDAKEPLGVLWAQGQNLTFTYNMGAGARYNLDSKYSFSAGMNYMHISNGYLSEPQFVNYGINVYGPMFGMNIRLGKPHHHAPE